MDYSVVVRIAYGWFYTHFISTWFTTESSVSEAWKVSSTTSLVLPSIQVTLGLGLPPSDRHLSLRESPTEKGPRV